MFVLDIDPRNGGDESLTRLERRYGVMGDTLAVVSGRGDGGVHRYYRRPSGALVSKHLGSGIDIKTSTGYCVMPPSIHPDSGRRYQWRDAEVGTPPQWLVDTMRPERRTTRPRVCSGVVRTGRLGIADAFCRETTWGGVLEPHGWRCVYGDGDSDGSRWLHPAATSLSSATVRNGCLFVYSPNTRFDVTEASDPHGYTKFRAFAVLNHDGDLPRAARELMRKAG